MTDPSISALLQAQEKALAGLGTAWDLVLKAAARAPIAGAKDPIEGAQQAVEAVEAVVALVGNATGPLRALVDAQRELAELLERWAELQRDTGVVLGALAKQQRLTADLLGATLSPLHRKPAAQRE